MVQRFRLRLFLIAAWLLVIAICAAPPAMAEESEGPGSLFRTEHMGVGLTLLVFAALYVFFVYSSRSGKELHLREIPGIAAIEEAVGRSTEMGRPVLFVPGLEKVDDIQTMAAISILGHVSRMVAEYDSSIIVPTREALVMSVCEETVRQAFTAAGHPESYRSDNVRYLSDEQFAFTAGVDGIILREKPAANLYFGSFFAESLILAETGQASGAIQVAGTARIPQLPFFIASCDYTILAEELYAVSAYLSHDRKSLAGIKASDWFKVLLVASLLLGIVLASLGMETTLQQFQWWF